MYTDIANAMVAELSAKLEELMTRERLFREDFTRNLLAEQSAEAEEARLRERQFREDFSQSLASQLVEKIEAVVARERAFREDFTKATVAELLEKFEAVAQRERLFREEFTKAAMAELVGRVEGVAERERVLREEYSAAAGDQLKAGVETALEQERAFREDFTKAGMAELVDRIEGVAQRERIFREEYSAAANEQLKAGVEAALEQERAFREEFGHNLARELRDHIDVRLEQRAARAAMAWPDSGRIFMHTSDGHRLFLDSREPFMALHLIEHGEWEGPVRQLMRKLLRPGDLYVDVGANIGVHALLATSLVGEAGAVIAVEPHPVIRRLLQDNLEANGLLQRVKVIAAAASDTDGGVTDFEYFPQHPAMSGFRVSSERIADFRGTPERIEVATASLDRIVADAGREPALVKIDVEGFELLVLKGAARALEGDTAFLIEYDRDLVASLMDERAVERLSALFASAGFEPFRVVEDGVVALSHDGFRREAGGDYLFVRPGGRSADALGLG